MMRSRSCDDILNDTARNEQPDLQRPRNRDGWYVYTCTISSLTVRVCSPCSSTVSCIYGISVEIVTVCVCSMYTLYLYLYCTYRIVAVEAQNIVMLQAKVWSPSTSCSLSARTTRSDKRRRSTR